MTSARTMLFGLLAATLLAPAAAAQSDATAQPVMGITSVQSGDERIDRAPAGPTRDAASVAVRTRAATTDADAIAMQGGSFGRAETLMIVGGAAFVAGLLIGDDAGTIVMVGGAVIGLYGLYLYLQQQ